VQVQAATCPARFACELVSGVPDIGRIGRIPSQAQGGPFIAATALGIALGALDDLADLVRGGKRPAFSTRRLADSAPFQDGLGDAQLTLAAARSLLHRETARADALGREGALAPFDSARLRSAAVKAIELAVHVVELAFSLAGSSSVYTSSPLQRRLRDVRTGAQHFAAGRDFYTPLGCLLVGETPPAALL
jgi:alkylation response protein AidB-like acyl-CoA dehydrogenase